MTGRVRRAWQSGTASLVRNPVASGTSWNLANSGTSLLITAISTPIVVGKLGLSRYGVVALTATVLSLTSNVDGGLVGTMQRYFARAGASGSGHSADRYLRSALAIAPALGVAASGLLAVIAPEIVGLFHIPPSLHGQAVAYLRVMGTLVPVSILSDIYSARIEAEHLWRETAIIGTLCQVLYAVVAVSLVLSGFKLEAIAIANVASAMLGVVAVVLVARKLGPITGRGFLRMNELREVASTHATLSVPASLRS